MSYYEEDFYNEPSEFDNMVEDFKLSLIQSVKEDFQLKMERLTKENKELQEVKANFDKIQKDFKQKELQLERERNDLERKVRNERLASLMKDFAIIMYRTGYSYEKKPKCNKCDNYRRVKYKTPLGKDASENCECDVSKTIYIPEEYQCSEFSIKRNGVGMSAHYKMKAERDYDYAVSSTFCETTYNADMKYEDVSQYSTFFKTEEECQGYCDYLNNQNNKSNSEDDDEEVDS